jgi:hypothetical protein
MSMIDRIKNIVLTPNTEWPVIADEPASTVGLIKGYVAPLAAVGAAAGFIGGSIVGRTGLFTGTYRVPFGIGLALAVYTLVAAIVGVVVIGFIINALAPTFGGQKDSGRAMKVAVYSFTPAWVTGILNIIPALGMLGVLGALYGLYLLYLGLPVLMKAPREKAVGYTAVTVICSIVVMVVVGTIGTLVVGAGAFATGALTPGLTSGLPGGSPPTTADGGDVQFDKNSALGKLQEFGKAMEESARKMEAAEKSGDPGATTAAAMETLGTLLGGGRRVDPLQIDQIKPFLPATVAGLNRQGTGNAERTGLAGLMIARADAEYSDGGSKTVTIEISDTGGASGLVGLATWAGVESSSENQDGSERTRKVDGRMVHEKTSKNGTNEYGVVLGERFVVNAKSRDMTVDQLRTIVSALDLRKLEAMKGVGVRTQ